MDVNGGKYAKERLKEVTNIRFRNIVFSNRLAI